MIIKDYFTEDTMSVHLKCDIPPMAKCGSIKDVQLVQMREEPATYEELTTIIDELLESAEYDVGSFEELKFNGAVVLQIGDMRIAISEPPFSDDLEITAVRPIASMAFDDYEMSDELRARILEQRGIMVAGNPGAGKSTFAAGLANHLHDSGLIVKTMESPRDLQVTKAITQYAPLDGSLENTADVLLLVRPDVTIYDEVRKTKDFEIFADMRMAGVGMVGVVHANKAVDAVQRLIGRIELGIIPQIVDTVVFLDKGEITKVFILEFTVKVPTGMTESDLARPVIVIKDLDSGITEYELYTYGEQVVVMPVGESSNIQVPVAASVDEIETVVSNYTKHSIEVEMIGTNSAVVYIDESDTAKVIGKGGKTIRDLEKMLGVSIDVRKLEQTRPRKTNSKKKIRKHKPTIERTKKHVILQAHEAANKDIEVFTEDEFMFSATVSKHGEIKVRMGTDIAENILEVIAVGDSLWVIEP